MKQMVFVVLDNGEVVGVYDEYSEAEAVASETATITPVIVGQTDDLRIGCETPDEVIESMEHELKNLIGIPTEEEDDDDPWNADPWDYEDEDEDEDENNEWNEDEEEESDPIEEMVYEMDGRRVISKKDADKIGRMFAQLILVDKDIPTEKEYSAWQQIMLQFAKDHNIWGVDMR